MLEIPLDKELTANCLVETFMKLEELIPAAMVDYGMIRVQFALWLYQSLLIVSHGMVCLGPQWSAKICKCAETMWNYKVMGVVYLKSPAFFFFIKTDN